MEELSRAVSTERETRQLRRFAIMSYRRTVEHVPFERFTVRDGLHMNDWGYQCIARLLATSIVAAASQPVPVAGGSLVQQARL